MFPKSMSTKNFFHIFLLRIKKLTVKEIIIIATIFSLLVIVIKYFGLKQEYKTIRVEIIRGNWLQQFGDQYGYRVPFWVSDKIKIGQKEINRAGKPVAEIISIDKFERGGEESELYLNIKVKVVHQKRQNRYLYNNKYYLDIGAPIEFNFDNTLLIGQIIENDVEKVNYPSKFIKIKLFGKNLEPWILDTLKPGYKAINGATNETILEIEKAEIFDPDTTHYIMSNGTQIKEIYNRQKNVYLYVKAKCFFKDQRWYYEGHINILRGNNLWIGMKDSHEQFEIVDYEDPNNQSNQ